jgi:hypothetical protein
VQVRFAAAHVLGVLCLYGHLPYDTSKSAVLGLLHALETDESRQVRVQAAQFLADILEESLLLRPFVSLVVCWGKRKIARWPGRCP